MPKGTRVVAANVLTMTIMCPYGATPTIPLWDGVEWDWSKRTFTIVCCPHCQERHEIPIGDPNAAQRMAQERVKLEAGIQRQTNAIMRRPWE